MADMNIKNGRDLYDMNLHQEAYLDLDDGVTVSILRVDGGWIYNYYDISDISDDPTLKHINMVFVPFSKDW